VCVGVCSAIEEQVTKEIKALPSGAFRERPVRCTFAIHDFTSGTKVLDLSSNTAIATYSKHLLHAAGACPTMYVECRARHVVLQVGNTFLSSKSQKKALEKALRNRRLKILWDSLATVKGARKESIAAAAVNDLRDAAMFDDFTKSKQGMTLSLSFSLSLFLSFSLSLSLSFSLSLFL
jgi:hypothetical protein